MTSLAVQTHPVRKLAPKTLPYTRFREDEDRKALIVTFDRQSYQRSLWSLPTEDLKQLWYRFREIVVECVGALDQPSIDQERRCLLRSTHDVAMLKVDDYAAELERRKHIAESGHHLAPPHDGSRRDELVERIRTVKVTWPIDRMVTQLMGIELRSVGRDHSVGLCPIHLEKTPSFHVYADTGRFHCYGCHESGDILDLIGYRLVLTRPADQLDALERWAATGLTA